MKINKTAAVDAALRTLSQDERRKVLFWFDSLGHWESDESVRKMSKLLRLTNTYVMNTTDDFRIFFALDEVNHEINILDLAKPSRFEGVSLVTG